jgi:type IV secretory pathway component VirB8
MDEVSRSILHNVRTGQYFVDARSWYIRKHVYPVVERSIMVIVATVFAVMAMYIAYVLSNLFPYKQEIPLILKLEDTMAHYPVVNGIGQDGEKAEYSLAKYFAKKYVLERENYSYHTLEKQINKVKNISSKYVFKKFYEGISLENPNSPVLLYQKNITRKIEILSVMPGDEGSVIVKYTATLHNYKGEKTETSTWIANVSYDMADIRLVLEKKADLDFVITDYNVQQIK